MSGLASRWVETSRGLPSGPGRSRKTRQTRPCSMLWPSWVSRATSESWPPLAAAGACLASGVERGTTVVLGGSSMAGDVGRMPGTWMGADAGGGRAALSVSVCHCWAQTGAALAQIASATAIKCRCGLGRRLMPGAPMIRPIVPRLRRDSSRFTAASTSRRHFTPGSPARQSPRPAPCTWPCRPCRRCARRCRRTASRSP